MEGIERVERGGWFADLPKRYSTLVGDDMVVCDEPPFEHWVRLRGVVVSTSKEGTFFSCGGLIAFKKEWSPGDHKDISLFINVSKRP
jgi:hypothetical protein